MSSANRRVRLAEGLRWLAGVVSVVSVSAALWGCGGDTGSTDSTGGSGGRDAESDGAAGVGGFDAGADADAAADGDVTDATDSGDCAPKHGSLLIGSCCSGQPCHGTCSSSGECDCYGVAGGCPEGLVCCKYKLGCTTELLCDPH
ncbi:MAG: hypothetical protein R3B13_01750 [Polyangiaceae bacterium]